MISQRLLTLRYFIWWVASKSDPACLVFLAGFGYLTENWILMGATLAVIGFMLLAGGRPFYNWSQPVIALLSAGASLLSPPLGALTLFIWTAYGLLKPLPNLQKKLNDIANEFQPLAGYIHTLESGKPEAFEIRFQHNVAGNNVSVFIAKKGEGWKIEMPSATTLTKIFHTKWKTILPDYALNDTINSVHTFSFPAPSAHDLLKGATQCSSYKAHLPSRLDSLAGSAHSS